MSSVGVDAAGRAPRIAWYLGRYAWVVVLCVLGLAAAGVLVGVLGPTTYQAQSLVVSLQLGNGVTTKALPALGESVFYGGNVATRVAEDPGVAEDPAVLVPDQLDVVVAQDSVVFTVLGRASDPLAAKRLADLGAQAFADELNRSGPGVGVFKVQAEAAVPTEGENVLTLPRLVVLGAAAGAILGIGIIALIATIRRPMIQASDVASVLDAPVLGAVSLPDTQTDQFVGPQGARGIAPVGRWVASAPAGLMLLVSDDRTASIRQQIFVMLAVEVARHRPISVRAPAPINSAVAELRERSGLGELDRPAPAAGRELVLVDGLDEHAIVDPRTPLSVVLVVLVGTSRAALRSASASYRPGELFGVVLADRRRGLRAAKAGTAVHVSGDRSSSAV